MKEADVTIEGVKLTMGQSMTLRMAVVHMLFDLENEEYMRGLGDIGPLYRERLLEIQALLTRGVR